MRAQRFTTKEKASLEVYGRQTFVVADLRNLSFSGACLEWTQTDVDLKKGDIVKVTVALKSLNRRHNLSAEVVWISGNRTGVNFIPHDQVLNKIVENR